MSFPRMSACRQKSEQHAIPPQTFVPFVSFVVHFPALRFHHEGHQGLEGHGGTATATNPHAIPAHPTPPLASRATSAMIRPSRERAEKADENRTAVCTGLPVRIAPGTGRNRTVARQARARR